MDKGPGKVIVLELNEITWDLLDPVMARGQLPNFRALAQQGVRGNAWASEQPEHLDPWITWTTVYTGVPQETHGLTMLEQDRETIGARRVWEYLREAGLRIGLFGSANSWPPQPVDGYWIPGPFSRDFATYPAELEPIQALNVGLTRGHTAVDVPMPSKKKLLPKLFRLGLTPATTLSIVREMAGIKLQPKTRWKMVAIQPILNLDLFAALYRRYRPHFATLHSNHVAYYQHRFWRAMQPEKFEVAPSEEEKATFGDCIPYGYKVADRMLGRLRHLAGPDTNIVVLSSCGQQPATGGRYSEDQRNGHVGLQIRVQKLLDALGLADKARYSNLMAPQWKIDVDDPALFQKALADLSNIRNTTRNTPALSAHEEGGSICIGPYRNQEMSDTLEVPTPQGVRNFKASDLLDRHAEVAKSGYHHPKGVLLMQGPDVRSGVVIDRCDNLDIAPTLMRLLGQPVPDVMRGRVLEEALRAEMPKPSLVVA
ncbi:MAG TPA: alkaline phosphatase family protein [Chthonomonadaceae bacterium]|nr:alkaline phosphatase family protein [Chthonomonadaceae bacterium]